MTDRPTMIILVMERISGWLGNETLRCEGKASLLTYDRVSEAGNVAWDMGSYDFLLGGFDSVFDSIHPSLQRQAVLNLAYGLYEVLPDKIYQVPGFDLANMTIIKGETGWILFDVLTCKKTARAALDFVNQQLGERPVVAVVYSHSHVDHFGGVRGVVSEDDVKSGRVQILGPVEFMTGK